MELVFAPASIRAANVRPELTSVIRAVAPTIFFFWGAGTVSPLNGKTLLSDRAQTRMATAPASGGIRRHRDQNGNRAVTCMRQTPRLQNWFLCWRVRFPAIF